MNSGQQSRDVNDEKFDPNDLKHYKEGADRANFIPMHKEHGLYAQFMFNYQHILPTVLQALSDLVAVDSSRDKVAIELAKF